MPSFNTNLSQGKFIVGIKIKKHSGNHASIEVFKNIKDKRALIDTGATHTSITQTCVSELNLVPSGSNEMTSASGVCEVELFEVDLAIPVRNILGARITEKEGKKVQEIQVQESHWSHLKHKVSALPDIQKDRGFDLILGMDILVRMHVTMFSGQIILSF